MLNIFDILKKDHQEINSLINETLSLENADEYRYELIDQIESEVLSHKNAEELTLYKSLKYVDLERDLVGDSFTEHTQIEQQLTRLMKKVHLEHHWKPLLTELKSLLKDHITEEETILFEEASHLLSSAECEEIGIAFIKAKDRFKKGYEIDNELLSNLLPRRVIDRFHELH